MTASKADEIGGVNVCAFLDTIAWCEGTINLGDNGYNVLVGGTLFDGYKDHPRKSVYLPRYKINSTAAGRYQLLSRYYDHYKKLLKLNDFSPKSQDKIAIQQIKEFRALEDVKAGRIYDAVRKLRTIWASFPGAGYGQHEHKMEQFAEQYLKYGGVITT